MNSDILPLNKSKYNDLKKGHNAQIHKHDYPDNLQTIAGVSNARVHDNLNQSTKQKQRSNSSSTPVPHTSSTKNTNSIAGKRQTFKLIDSKQGTLQQADKKTFLLDTYARIVASNNRRCPKRLRELAKPKRQARNDQNDYFSNFEPNYPNTAKTYGDKTKRTLIESKKK
ncbi:uncharacterized protein [Linepithema humile]|uniref:uncharacterized protein n=1 Tax=Linepithema humile TaxID=83485 RepID=UPI00351DD7C7